MIIASIAEDQRIADFLVAAIQRVAAESDSSVQMKPPELTVGCRRRALIDLVQVAARSSEVIVVGVDAAGERHRSRRRPTYRQKAKSIRDILGSECTEKVVLAVPEPSVEAWLFADADAFARGLEEGTGQHFKRPRNWPTRPSTEHQAKELLGRLVVDGLEGSFLPQAGFEYCELIVSHIRWEATPSLLQFKEDLRKVLRPMR